MDIHMRMFNTGGEISKLITKLSILQSKDVLSNDEKSELNSLVVLIEDDKLVNTYYKVCGEVERALESLSELEKLIK